MIYLCGGRVKVSTANLAIWGVSEKAHKSLRTFAVPTSRTIFNAEYGTHRNVAKIKYDCQIVQ